MRLAAKLNRALAELDADLPIVMSLARSEAEAHG
jgi:hypothetical protein